jgi:hypothetical protein
MGHSMGLLWLAPSLLFSFPFISRLISISDKPYQPLNGALMRFQASSPYLCSMLSVLAQSPPPRPHSTDWGSLLYRRTHAALLALPSPVKPFGILPWCFFDGRSCRLDNRLPDPFKSEMEEVGKWSESRQEEVKRRTEKAVWGIHLHNQWEKEFVKGSWIWKYVIERLGLDLDLDLDQNQDQ